MPKLGMLASWSIIGPLFNAFVWSGSAYYKIHIEIDWLNWLQLKSKDRMLLQEHDQIGISSELGQNFMSFSWQRVAILLATDCKLWNENVNFVELKIGAF